MKKALDILKKHSVEAVLLVLMLMFTIVKGTIFLNINNIITILRQSSILGIMSIGMMFCMLSGGLNLAVGSMVSLVTVTSAVFMTSMNIPWPVAFLVSVAICTFSGWATGFIIVKTRIWPMIGSLAMQTILSGVAYIVCGGLPIYDLPKGSIIFGQANIGVIPLPVIILLAVAVVSAFILNKTYFGRHFYVSGSNVEAARLSGINTSRICIMSYVISGFLCGIAGVIMTGRVSSGQPAAGKGMDMTCLTAVVLGGVSMNGGEGKVSKVVVGVFILGVLKNGMTIMNVDEYTQMIVEGLIFLFAVCFDSLQRILSERTGKKKAA
ncbi:MAG: ABC transporter permease [Dorea sp.]|jgi:Ribose/xylose/arabinose/galactoside ABC-type transport systems, permease components|nr:ABC transporter permease [Dorea sp.]MCI9615964.1 ABC transporter permease [Dorea sp.]